MKPPAVSHEYGAHLTRLGSFQFTSLSITSLAQYLLLFLCPELGIKTKSRMKTIWKSAQIPWTQIRHSLGLKLDAFGIRLMPFLKMSCCYPHKLEELQTAKYHQSSSEFSRTPIQKDPGLNVRMRGVRKISNVLKRSLTALRVEFDVSSYSKMNKDLMSEGIWMML